MNRIIWCNGRLWKVLNAESAELGRCAYFTDSELLLKVEDIETGEITEFSNRHTSWVNAYDYIGMLEATLKKIRELV